MDIAINIKNVTKCFGNEEVLHKISHDFEEGKIHGIVGNNGSGKTVLMKCICGFLIPTSGKIFVGYKQIGKDADSPFAFKNYQNTVSLSQNAVNGSDAAIASYLVYFELSLASNRNNGNYPVTINIQGQGSDGSPIQQSFTSYITIIDGIDPNAPLSTEPPPVVETPLSQPKVLVGGYSINPSPIIADTEFTVQVILKNTNETESVQNMTVTAVCESANISLQNESYMIYISKLGNGKTLEITLVYKAALEIPAGKKRYLKLV